MIDDSSREKLLDAEPYAPKRLKRSDVAAIRDLYTRAWRSPSKGWSDCLTVPLHRDDARRAVAKLGAAVPAVVITSTWTVKHELGLDVAINAHTLLGNVVSQRLFVGNHRFRIMSTQTQFCREVARMVRLALGWLRVETTTLKEILR